MVDKIDCLSRKRLRVIGKGGAGKSTSVVLLATALQRLGYTVSVLDAGSTNVGLHQALAIDTPPRPFSLASCVKRHPRVLGTKRFA